MQTILILTFIFFCLLMYQHEIRKKKEGKLQLAYWVKETGATHFTLKDNHYKIFNRGKFLCELKYHPSGDDTNLIQAGYFSVINNPTLTLPSGALDILCTHELQQVIKQLH